VSSSLFALAMNEDGTDTLQSALPVFRISDFSLYEPTGCFHVILCWWTMMVVVWLDGEGEVHVDMWRQLSPSGCLYTGCRRSCNSPTLELQPFYSRMVSCFSLFF